MTDKEKADCLIELHREQLGKFKQTRDIEFKINLALWTFIVLAGFYLNKNVLLKEYLDYLGYVIISICIVIAHCKFWMKPIKLSEDTDDYYINQYRTQIEKLTDIKIEKYNSFKKKFQNWELFEVGITAFLLLIVGIYSYLIRR